MVRFIPYIPINPSYISTTSISSFSVLNVKQVFYKTMNGWLVFLLLCEQSNVELDLTFGRQQKVNNPHVKVSYRRSSQSFQLLTPQSKDV